MKLRVRISGRARLDLGEAWDYIFANNLAAADEIIGRILAACQSFASTPDIGRLRVDIGEGIRGLPIKNYLIFYRVFPDRVEILRILHGARDIQSLSEDPDAWSFEVED